MGSLGENCSLMPHTEKHYGALKSKIIPTIPVKSKELTSERESRDSKAVHKQKKWFMNNAIRQSPVYNPVSQ